MTDDQRFELWSTWLGEIYEEVEDLLIRRHVFWEVQSIIRSNPRIDQPNSFHSWMGRSYVDSAVMGVRRQVGIRKDSISFVRLLDNIHREPHILSRQRFVALYQAKDAPESWAHKDFDAAVGSNEQHIPRSWA